MTSGIYKILNKINDKVYIGSSVNIESRFCSHKRELRNNKHKNARLQNAWNKHGEDAFQFEVVEVCSKSATREKEQEYLNELFKTNRDLYYNIYSDAIGISSETATASNKLRWSNEENKIAASIKQKEIWSNPELLTKHSEIVLASRGKIDKELWSKRHRASHNTEEYKVSAAIRAKKQWENSEIRSKMESALTSEESKKKKSDAANRNYSRLEYRVKHKEAVLKALTPELLEIRSKNAKAFFSNAENRIKRGKSNPHRRVVICNETGKEYDSVNQAAKELDVCHKAIKKATKPGKTCKGLSFRFKD